jgi:hypothetical protein
MKCNSCGGNLTTSISFDGPLKIQTITCDGSCGNRQTITEYDMERINIVPQVTISIDYLCNELMSQLDKVMQKSKDDSLN